MRAITSKGVKMKVSQIILRRERKIVTLTAGKEVQRRNT